MANKPITPTAAGMGLPPGWYPICKGPRNGQNYYAPNEPRPGQPVYLGIAGANSNETRYEFNAQCTTFVYTDRVHTKRHQDHEG